MLRLLQDVLVCFQRFPTMDGYSTRQGCDKNENRNDHPRPARRFPPPGTADDPDIKLGQDCYIVRDANGHALAYVYFEDEPGRRKPPPRRASSDAQPIAGRAPRHRGR